MNRNRRRDTRPRPRVEALEGRHLLATFTVSNVSDTGAGSFRQAILDSDGTSGTNSIVFAIPGAGVHTITPATPLPEINNAAVVDATTQPGYAGTPLIELNGSGIFAPGLMPPTPLGGVDGIILSGGASTLKGLTIDRFTGYGVAASRDGNTIASNFIGTDPTGTRALGNAFGGILVFSRNNMIGGPDAASRNVISGNGFQGIELAYSGGQRADNVIERNLIGTDAAGVADLGNAGPGIEAESSNNTIGGPVASLGNTIAFNGGAGVQVGSYIYASGATGNTISANSIFRNVGIGIDLGGDGVTFNHSGSVGFGPNLLQNYPVLTSAYAAGGGTTVEGTLNAAPQASYTIAFYASPQADPTGFGQGRTFLGTTTATTDGNGNADVTSTLPVAVAPGQVVSATATDALGNTSEFARSVAATATAQANLMLTASDPNPTAQVGVAQTYAFTVRNAGPSKATGVVFTNVLPAGATFLTGSTTQGNLVQSGGTATANLGDLAEGASATITLTYTLPTAGPASSQATVIAAQVNPSPQDATVTQNILVNPAPPADLSVSGAATPEPVQVGDVLTYTFVVRNLTYFDQATGVVLTDMLPQGVTFVSARSSQGVAAQAGGVVTASLGVIPGGSNATVTILVRPTGPGTLSNTATVQGSQPDPDATNNSATVTSTVAPAPAIDLAVAITAAPQPAEVGFGFTYAVIVANIGSGTATGVTLTDLLPDAATLSSIKPSQGTYTLSGGTLTVALGSLAPGAQALVTVVLDPGAPGTIFSRASVVGDQPDFNIANNTTTLATAVLADQSGPLVVAQKLTVARRTITSVVLTFDKALDPTLADETANYQILDLGQNGNLSASGRAVAIASASFDPATRSVTLTPQAGLSVGRFYQVVVNGPGAPGLVDTSGNVLDGANNGLQNSIYQSLIGRGTRNRPTALQVGVPAPSPSPVRTSSHSAHARLHPALATTQPGLALAHRAVATKATGAGSSGKHA